MSSVLVQLLLYDTKFWRNEVLLKSQQRLADNVWMNDQIMKYVKMFILCYTKPVVNVNAYYNLYVSKVSW